ncbi:lipoprotein [Streptomyces sp. NPDC046909]|uniref:lipoprotein n=1 Tax=Streptomyces sp. NPDC046909 TaxID=3155617 RepID=UPI0033DBBC4E
MAYVALLAGVLAGCSGSAEDGDAKSPVKATAKATATASASATVSKTAEPGGSIGAAGSACELPVTFDTAAEWTAESVQAELTQGPVTLRCEIDAKPAGSVGFLRAWTGKPGDADARSVLEGFLAAVEGATVSEERYSTFKTGDLTGAQVTYIDTNEILDEPKEESALAVITTDGPVVLHLGGMDTEEHRDMLPAFELAKSTLREG